MREEDTCISADVPSIITPLLFSFSSSYWFGLVKTLLHFSDVLCYKGTCTFALAVFICPLRILQNVHHFNKIRGVIKDSFLSLVCPKRLNCPLSFFFFKKKKSSRSGTFFFAFPGSSAYLNPFQL